MDNPEIRFLGDLHRISPKPGDRFVLTMPKMISANDAHCIQQHWKRFMGDDFPLLIIDDSMKLECVQVFEEPPSNVEIQ